MVDPEGYIDVNVFIYWLGNHPVFGQTAYKWVKKVEEAARGKYVTSTLTLYQTLVIIAGLADKNFKDEKLVGEFVGSIISLPGLSTLPLALEDLTQAAELMKEYGLDYEDALHVAAALRSKAKFIVSNDEDFDKTPITRIFK